MTQAEIFVDNDVILDGEGNLTVDGDKEHRVFSVSENVTVELRGLTVTGGSSLPPDFGGGIFNGGKLTLVNTVVRDNIAQDDFECCRDPSWNAGGGIHNDGELTLVSSTVSGNAAFTGGGIASHGGELTMSNSTISGNTAADGGGIYNGGVSRISNSTISGNTAADGAGIYNGVDAALTTTNSVVSENTAGQDGGGIYNSLGDVELAASTVLLNTAERGGGGIYNHGELTMTSSTIWRNVAEGTDDCPNPNPCPGGGGGIFNLRELTMTNSTVSANTSKSGGGGVSNRDVGSCTLINSTLSGNTARDDGGGISNRDRGSYTLINCTVSGNAAPQGSAMSKSGNQSVTIRNSLVDGDCTGPSDFTSNSYNVESPGDTCGFHQEGDQVDVSSDDLKVGPLQDNGGPTETHALGAGSVAIDQIPVEDCVDADGAPLTTDQRGEPRPGGTMCDVGAFEVQP
ncbi:MAG: choice-of-anchor Q domain-containing protein [Polyangiales bacterium]